MSRLDEVGSAEWWRERLVDVDCVGIDRDELTAVREDQRVSRLPAAYQGFLEVAGRKCGVLWIGSDAFFPALLGLRTAAVALLKDCETDLQLAPGDVVVAMHQGYEFLYLPGGEDDPPVMRFTESDTLPHKVGTSYTQFVLSALSEMDS